LAPPGRGRRSAPCLPEKGEGVSKAPREVGRGRVDGRPRRLPQVPSDGWGGISTATGASRSASRRRGHSGAPSLGMSGRASTDVASRAQPARPRDWGGLLRPSPGPGCWGGDSPTRGIPMFGSATSADAASHHPGVVPPHISCGQDAVARAGVTDGGLSVTANRHRGRRAAADAWGPAPAPGRRPRGGGGCRKPVPGQSAVRRTRGPGGRC